MKTFDDEIRAVLFEIGKDIKIHKIDDENMIVEIDYDKYVEMFKSILGGYNDTPGTLQ
jgi:hemerythrin